MADQTSTTTSNPWAFIQPYLSQVLGQYFNAPQPQPWTGPQVAPMSGYTSTAIDMTNQLAQNGTPASNAGKSALAGIASGDIGNPFIPSNNPYLEGMVASSNADITKNWQQGMMSPMSTMLAQQGAFGGASYNQGAAQAGGELANRISQNEQNIRGNAYNQSAQLAQQQLGQQIAAAQGGINSQQGDLAAIGALMNAGKTVEGFSQADIDAMKSYFQQVQSQPFVYGDILRNAIYPLLGAGGTTTSEASGPGQSYWPLLAMLAAGGLSGGLGG